MRAHPGRVLWLKARNALYLFSPQLLPRDAKSIAAFAVRDGDTVRIVNAPRRPRLDDAAHAAAQSVLLALAAIGLARRGIPGRDAPLLILLGGPGRGVRGVLPDHPIDGAGDVRADVLRGRGVHARIARRHRASLTGSSAAAPPRP